MSGLRAAHQTRPTHARPPARPRVHYRRANGSVVISSDSLIRHGFSCDDRAVLAEVCCSDAYRGGVVVGREGGGGLGPAQWAAYYSP